MKSKVIRAILFDFGGTLAEMSPAREDIFLKSIKPFGLNPKKTALRDAYRMVDFCYKYSSVAVRSPSEKEEFYRMYNMKICAALGMSGYFEKIQPGLRHNFKKLRRWKLINGVKGVLSGLKRQDLRMGIVANWDTGLGELSDELGIRNFFDGIIASQDAGLEKPDPKIFLQAMAGLNIDKKDAGSVIYLGNEYESDVVGARSAGMRPVLIDRCGFYPYADCPRFSSLGKWFDSLD